MKNNKTKKAEQNKTTIRRYGKPPPYPNNHFLNSAYLYNIWESKSLIHSFTGE